MFSFPVMDRRINRLQLKNVVLEEYIRNLRLGKSCEMLSNVVWYPHSQATSVRRSSVVSLFFGPWLVVVTE